MATVYGSNYSNAYVETPPSKYGKGEYNGTVQVMYDEYVFIADVTAIGEIIKMGKLPAGARVVGTVVKAATSGTTGIAKFGYAANGVDSALADAFDAAADFGGQAVHSLGDGVDIGKKFTVETEIQLELTEATDSALGDTIKTWVYFIVD